MTIAVSDLIAVAAILVTLSMGLIGTIWFMLNKRIDALGESADKLASEISAIETSLTSISQRQDDKRGELASRVFADIEKIRDRDITEIRSDIKDLLATVNGLDGQVVTRQELSEWCATYEKGRQK